MSLDGILPFAPISVGVLLSFTATAIKSHTTASETISEHTLVQRVAPSLPWDLVATENRAFAVIVPLALIAIDLALGPLGWLGPSTDG